jgi:hypothetical protein
MCIMSMIWLSGSVDDPLGFTVSSRGALGPRIGLTVVFSLGLVYFALIMKTFHRYGDPLDREWMRKVKEWTKEGSIRALYGNMPHLSPRRPLSPLRPSDYKPPVIPLPAHSPTHEGEPGFIKIRPSPPLTALPSAFLEPLNNYEPRPFPPLNPIRMMKLGQPGTEARMTGHLMGQHPIQAQDWDRFVLVRYTSHYCIDPLFIHSFYRIYTVRGTANSRSLVVSPPQVRWTFQRTP